MKDHDWTRDVVKAMTQPTVSKSVKSLSWLAGKMGIPDSTLYAYGKSLSMPIRLIPSLTQATGDYTLIEMLCDLCGGTFIHGEACVTSEASYAHVVRESSETMAEMSKALEDGEIDEAELNRIEKEFREEKIAKESWLNNARQEISRRKFATKRGA